MIDSHCHLADKQFSSDLGQIISRAKSAGVDKLITISDTLKEGKKCIEICEKYSDVFCAVGVHPHAAKEWKMENGKLIMNMIGSSNKVVAVGEIGLDYFYDNSPRDVQRDVFKTQLSVARDMDYPVVVHCRDAISDLKKIIDDVGYEKIVIHCCTEKWEDVSDLVDRRFMFGFTGIATYAKSEHIREVINNCPLEQIMIETDSPYLAPDKFRGKRNEPAFVVEVAKLISEIKGVDLEEVDRVTTENTVRFFEIGAGYGN